jgi:hypothetical protein
VGKRHHILNTRDVHRSHGTGLCECQ